MTDRSTLFIAYNGDFFIYLFAYLYVHAEMKVIVFVEKG